ncbi:MAG: MFS transporter [Steroidobacteraceae bacterium]|nr:MFS transporter [Nevskiaceae bacterium]MCP5472500.1 MFS transporter [Nevskiaceae bacterium]
MRRWTVLLGCFLGLAVSTSAILMFPLGLYMQPVTTEFGWSRTQFSSVLSVVALGNIIALPLAGYAIDRFGPIRCIAVGLVIACLSYAAVGQASSYALFLALCTLASVAGCLAHYPAYFTIARGWFDRNIGLALAIASAGVSTGVAGFAWLIKATIAAGGWRVAFATVGTTAAVIGLGSLLFLIRSNPGVLPAAEQLRTPRADATVDATLGEALRSRDYWYFTLGFALIVFAGAGPNLHLPALMADGGAGTAAIAAAVAAIPLGSLAGRVVAGMMLDRFSVRAPAAVFFGAQAVGILLLWVDLRSAVAAAFLMGTAMGAELDIMGYVMARRFGRRAYARIFGTSFALSQIGLIISPIGMAAIFDVMGSYDIALLGYLPLSIFAFVLVALANVRPDSMGSGQGHSLASA